MDLGDKSWVILVGVMKWVGSVGRIEEREREMEAVGGITMAVERDGLLSSSGFSGFLRMGWVVESISSIREVFRASAEKDKLSVSLSLSSGVCVLWVEIGRAHV